MNWAEVVFWVFVWVFIVLVVLWLNDPRPLK
jgi:hypothetical protein